MSEALVFRRVRAVDPAGALDAEVDVVVERGVITRVGRDAPRPTSCAASACASSSAGRVAAAGPRRPARPPARARRGVQGGRRERPPRGRGGRLRRRVLHAQHAPGQRLARRDRDARREGARRSAACGCTPSAPSRSGQQGRAAHRDGRPEGRRRRRRQRRRALRDEQPGHAPRPRVRGDLRPPGHPARRGPRAHRGRADARGRDLDAGSACAAGRASPRTSSSRATCSLAEYVGARYHVAHVSTARRGAHPPRGQGARASPVTAEVTPHHLLLTARGAARLRHRLQGQPSPARGRGRRRPCARALADGTIDCIATDHAPHGSSTRTCELAEAAPGMIGLELLRPAAARARPRGRPAARAPRRRAHVGARRASPASPPPRIRDGRAGRPRARRSGCARWTIDPARLRPKSRNTPFAGQRRAGTRRDDGVRGADRPRSDATACTRGAMTDPDKQDRAWLVLADGTVVRGAALRRARGRPPARRSSRPR